jgi:hypothetical protein
MTYRRSPEEFEFTSEHERVLRDLTIDESGPGTVLHDFGAFLAFVKGQELPVTPMHQLRRRVLPEINARLARPLQLGLKKPLQKSYPHIHGLYLLVRASGLTCIEGTAKKPLLVVDDAVYQVWEGLNPTERYCTLLEAWLLRGHPEIVGERGRSWLRIPGTFTELLWFSLRTPDEGLPIGEDEKARRLLGYWPGWHNLGLLELFGLISIHPGPPEPGKNWRIKRIERTPLGDALLALLQAGFFGDIDNIPALESEDEIPFGVLQPTLRPYFPEWKTNLSVPEWAFREGAHVFKISLWDIWRRIAIPPDQTLDALASAILDAVEFDHDHLYEFKYQNRFGVLEHVNHPYMDEGPWTSEVLVGNVPLRVGQAMTYVFDFGDRWQFDVTLERVDPEMVIEAPVLLEKHGESPSQYGW